MAATKKAVANYPQPEGRATTMTLGLAGNPMISVGFKMKPLVASGTGRLSAHYVCVEHGTQIKQVKTCEDCGGPCESVLAYDHEDGQVFHTNLDLGFAAANEKRLELQAMVDPGDVDPLYFEKAYEIWSDVGFESAFDLLAASLRQSGKYAVGTATMNKATKAVVLRWSEAAGCLVLHACTYDARIAWEDITNIKAGVATRTQPDEKQAVEAGKLFEMSLATEFDFGAVKDEYAAGLEDAVNAAAKGVAPTRIKAVEPDITTDLMAALRASVVAAPKKPAAKKKVAA